MNKTFPADGKGQNAHSTSGHKKMAESEGHHGQPEHKIQIKKEEHIDQEEHTSHKEHIDHEGNTHGEHNGHQEESTGHEQHTGHEGHASHSPEMFRKRFWVTLLLTIPVLIYSHHIQMWLRFSPPHFLGASYVPFILGTVIFLYGGSVFLKGGWDELRSPCNLYRCGRENWSEIGWYSGVFLGLLLTSGA